MVDRKKPKPTSAKKPRKCGGCADAREIAESMRAAAYESTKRKRKLDLRGPGFAVVCPDCMKTILEVAEAIGDIPEEPAPGERLLRLTPLCETCIVRIASMHKVFDRVWVELVSQLRDEATRGKPNEATAPVDPSRGAAAFKRARKAVARHKRR